MRKPLIRTAEIPSIKIAARLAAKRGSTREERIAFSEALVKDARDRARKLIQAISGRKKSAS